MLRLDKFKRYPLTFGPTPIEHLPRLTAAIGGKVQIYAKRNYFVYSTNGHIKFPLIEHSLEKMEKRLKEVSMGYTSLMLLKRKAVYLDGKWIQLAEEKLENIDKSLKLKEQYYCTFLFFRMNPSVNYVMFSPIDGTARHSLL